MIRAAALLFLAAPALAQPAFIDRSAELPVRHQYTGGWEHFVGGGVAVFDCNEDGLPEILAAGGTSTTRLFLNRSDGDIAFESAPFPDVSGVTGAYSIDIDSDGLRDVVLLRVGPNMLLRGTGGCGFEDAGAQWGFEAFQDWTTAFSATWEPGASWPTLAFGNYVDRTDPDGPFEACDRNLLYRPAEGGFDRPAALEPGFCALSMLFSDWNRSGQQDLRVSNDRHYYVRGGSEQMWRLSPLRLLDQADGWEGISIWGMGIGSRDLDGDLLPEVFLTSMGDQILQYARPGPEYVAAPFDVGTYAHRPHTGDDGRPSTGWHAEFDDVNNDGLADLFIAKGNVDQMPSNAIRDPNNLLIQQRDGRFVEAAAAAGVASAERSRGAAVVDLNADGLLDLVVLNRRAPLEVYQNASEDAGNWLSITPRMPGPNREAVGSWVELRLPGGRVQTQEVTIGGGHAGGHMGPLHFGLGPAKSAQVRVLWPSGVASDWITLSAGRRVTLGPGPNQSLTVD